MRFHLMSTCLAGSVLMAQAAIGQTVTVQSGDSLYSIAQTHLGNGTAWSELCAANSELLNGDCNRLSVGMVLSLPGQPEIEAEPAPVVEVEPAPVVETEPAPEETVEPAVEPAPAETTLQDVTYDFSTVDAEIFTAPDGFTVEHQLSDGSAQLSGNVEGAASFGLTEGISLKLPTEIELAASDNIIVVEVLARLNAPGQIDLAYSTNDVGNSGWRRFDLGTSYERLELRYRVSEIVNGKDDYLGFLPDPLNTGQVLDISFIGISVLD
ncbi:LysM domain-containing protein [Monaibacterium marinum]|uniref:LysM domain-containing protein n=1 Tax=Pontivivens marinum TaxID=1690039 RepID=A0A2C9CWB5_9RHOB|nr:LysM domain-containing protein [Monaibacterium marinum]SOH95503.1 LysM domain-containing protein [Monaibacterium marinum]